CRDRRAGGADGEVQTKIDCAPERQAREKEAPGDARQATGRHDRRSYAWRENRYTNSQQSAAADALCHALESLFGKADALAVLHHYPPGWATGQVELQPTAQYECAEQHREREPKGNLALRRARRRGQQNHVARDRHGHACRLNQHDRARSRLAIRFENRLDVVYITVYATSYVNLVDECQTHSSD